jgi:acyl carrier protein
MLEKIIAYLAEQVDLDPSTLNADTTFESLDLDSLDLVEMLVELEAETDVELPEEETKQLETIGDLAALIESKL